MKGSLPLFLLWVLALTDAGFCGFRDGAGRSARIFKADIFRRAMRRGLRHGFATSLLVGALAGVMVVMSPSPDIRFTELLACAGAMLWVLVPYATLVLVALGGWAASEADFRTVATVLVLGPFTLIRPWVILAAGVLALWRAPSATGGIVTVVACALQLGIEPWLGRAAYWTPERLSALGRD